MLGTQFLPRLPHLPHLPWRSWRILIHLCLMLTLLLNVSCAQLRWPGYLTDTDLILQVAAADTPGTYILSGAADLPDKTELTVTAIRQLKLDGAAQIQSNPTYSILAYQTARVINGKWQAQLNLWQVAPDGKYQEAWQLELSRLELSLKPDEDVIFLAILTSDGQISGLEQQLASRGMRLTSRSLMTTAEGQRYAQASQALAIALPNGTTTAPRPQLEDVNYGWGYRYLIPQEPQNPYSLEFPEERQTNAPPRPGEFLQ